MAIFWCGYSILSLTTSQEAKIARALQQTAVILCFLFSAPAFTWHLRFEKALFGCILIPTMLRRVCSECELKQAFLMCSGTLFPTYIGRPQRRLRTGKQEVPWNKSLKWITPIISRTPKNSAWVRACVPSEGVLRCTRKQADLYGDDVT